MGNIKRLNQIKQLILGYLLDYDFDVYKPYIGQNKNEKFLLQLIKVINEENKEKKGRLKALLSQYSSHFLKLSGIIKRLKIEEKINPLKFFQLEKLFINSYKEISKYDKECAILFQLAFDDLNLRQSINIIFDKELTKEYLKIKITTFDNFRTMSLKKAKFCFDLAFSIKEIELINYFWMLRSIVNRAFAIIYSENNEYNNALELNLNSIEIFKKLYKNSKIVEITGFNFHLGDIYRDLGHLYIFKDDYINAEKNYLKSLECKTKSENTRVFDIPEILTGLAKARDAIGKRELSYNHLKEALSILNDFKLDDELMLKKAGILQNFAVLSRKRNNISEFIVSMLEALRILDELPRNSEIEDTKAIIKLNLAMYDENTFGNTFTAIEYLKKAYKSFSNTEKFDNFFELLSLGYLCLYITKAKLNNQYKEFFIDFKNKIVDNIDSYSLSYLKKLEILYITSEIYYQLGERKNSNKICDNVIEFYNSLSEEQKINSRRFISLIYHNKARLLQEQKVFNEAVYFLKKAIDINEEDYQIDTIRKLNLAQNYNSKANCHANLNQISQALQSFQKSKLLKEELLQDCHNDMKRQYQVELAHTFNDHGRFYLEIKQYRFAIEHLEKALYLYNKELYNIKLNENVDETEGRLDKIRDFKSNSLDNLGILYLRKLASEKGTLFRSESDLIENEICEFQKSLEYLENSKLIREQLFVKYPDDIVLSIKFANTLNNIGLLKVLEKKKSDAIEYFIKSIDILECLVDKEPYLKTELSTFYNNLTRVFLSQSDFKNAISTVEKAYIFSTEANDFIQKTFSITLYFSLKILSPDIDSKIFPVNLLESLLETIKKVEILNQELELPYYKMLIEVIYHRLLINLSNRLANIIPKWRDLTEFIEVIQSLRSGSSFLFANNLKIKDSVIEENKFDTKQLITEIQEYRKKRDRILAQIEHNSENKFELLNNLLIIQEETRIYFELLKEETNQVIFQETKTIEMISDFLANNKEIAIFIVQVTNIGIVFAILNNKNQIVRFDSKLDFLENGRELSEKLMEYNKTYFESSKIASIINEIEKISEELWKCIPDEIRSEILTSETIILSLCGESQIIPIELLRYEKQYLGLNKIITRIFSLRHFLNDISFNKSVCEKIVILISDPLTEKEQLEYAQEECEELKAKLDKMKIKNILMSGENARMSDLDLKSIVNCMFLHISAHGEKEGIPLVNEVFNTEYLKSNFIWFIGKPLIFLNVCFTGETKYFGGGSFQGFVPTLFRHNSGPIISSSNRIDTKTAYLFAQEFYNYFLSGYNVGKALLKAREKINRLETIQDKFQWANYQLYGNPNYSLQ